jgi:hypothetical protein
MLLEEVKQYFGTTYQFNKKTGMHHASFSNWEKKGYIPIKTQIKLEKITNGELKANLEHITADE